MNAPPRLLHLTAGDAELVLAPDIGGSIVAYRDHRHGQQFHWMRPVSAEAVARRSVSDMACFPLVPWSGRLRNGTFVFNGKRITVPSNKPGAPNTIHGLGRYAPWQVKNATADTACLRYEHAPHAWPFAFSAEQSFVLTERSLSITMQVFNTSSEAMPVGVGHHPYFPRNEHTTVATGVGKAWFSDADVMPTHIGNHPAASALARGMRVDDFVLDNAFLGWSQQAVIKWPDQGRSLTMTAQSPLDYVVLYSPPDTDSFCVEPVSNTTDSFNLIHDLPRRDVGGGILGPGEHLSASFTLTTAFV